MATLQIFVNDGMEQPVVCEAIRRTRLQGKTNISYTKTILNDWLNRQVTTMDGVSRVDLEFEQSKKSRASPGKGKSAANQVPKAFSSLDAWVQEQEG